MQRCEDAAKAGHAWRPDRARPPLHPLLALQRAAGNRATAALVTPTGRSLARDSPWSSAGVRSPVFEELVTQVSTIDAGLRGRPLTRQELALVEPVFGRSIDYHRVRLIPTAVLEYRTVANTIRVPHDFTVQDEYMAQTLVHELTHVWQYQHGGTAYISTSLATQIAGAITTGSRNAAYDYKLTGATSFFDFTPEQQGLIVENYYAMQVDAAAPPSARGYRGNHLAPNGDFQVLSHTQRRAEIARELPLHEPLIRQMRAALPRPESELLADRARDVIGAQQPITTFVPEERQVAPIRPLVEFRF